MQLAMLVTAVVCDIASSVTGVARFSTRLGDKAQAAWAFQMIVGTMLFIMADTGRLKRLSGGACDPKDVDATLRYIMPLLLDGLRGKFCSAKCPR